VNAPRFLFWLGLSLAASLFALVLLAPLLDDGNLRLLTLFARDAVVRRTTLASAIGLAVTACVFFRAPPPVSAPVAVRKVSRKPPPQRIVGA